MLEEIAERAAADAVGSGGGQAATGDSNHRKAKEGSAAYSQGDALRHVDVTSLAVQLPPLTPSARIPVRNWSHAEEVIRGKDYEAAYSWVLNLPPELMLQASGLTVWIGEVILRRANQHTVWNFREYSTQTLISLSESHRPTSINSLFRLRVH